MAHANPAEDERPAASERAKVVGPESATSAIVVDLDGTLTPSDTLVEQLIALTHRHPDELPALAVRAVRGRAGLKAYVASRARWSADRLPYCQPLIDYLHEQRARGRKIILATGADRAVADAVATRLGLFDAVLASDGARNLKGQAKLDGIRQLVGNDFVYAGDSAADLPIWAAARAAILVAAPTRVAQRVRATVAVEREFARPRVGVGVWLRALRVHQWLKNLLLFVPLLTAFSFSDARNLIALTLAFIAFSLAASATYIVNDLWDLASDRAHLRKRLRPLASGELSIPLGGAAAAAALATALLVAAALSGRFLLVLLLYLAVSSAYSWKLKEYVIVDVLVLALLYTLRIIAGAVVVGVDVSSWLLAFSVFLFFSLALLKRCSELVSLERAGSTATRGRDYRAADLAVLWPLGAGSGLCAVVVFGLFISAPETQARYAGPQLLWLVAVGLIYWLCRLWIKSARGEMHEDPVVYAVRDFGSRVTLLAMIVATIAAHFLSMGAP
jgi:4-hydroxybenzoate polyprenyltransferase/phosphoserine phosphatase